MDFIASLMHRCALILAQEYCHKDNSEIWTHDIVLILTLLGPVDPKKVLCHEKLWL